MQLKSYPVLRILLFFIFGLLLPSASITALSIFLVLLALGLLIGLKTKHSILLSVPFWLLIAVFGNFLKTYDRYSKTGFSNFENTQAYIIRIGNSPEKKPKSYKALAQILSYKKDSIWHESDAQTLLYFNLDSEITPTYGETYLIQGHPREIEGPKNPEEFNYKQFQANKGILTHHFLRAGDAVLLDTNGGNPIFGLAYKMNAYAKDVFHKFIKTPANSAVASAMIIGIKDELDNELRDSYATAGAVHILAVSGLHVGILFLLLTYLFSWINRFKNGDVAFAVIVVATLWLYALFTGLSPSVTRSTLMFTIFQFGSSIRREKNSINTIAISALVLLILNPSWLYEVGFQLSYLAIFGIVYLYPHFNDLWRPRNYFIRQLWQISAVSVCAQLFTFPLSIYYFHQFPNYFLLTNPVVTILSTLILFSGIILLFFAKIPFLGVLLAKFFDICLSVLNAAVKWIEALPGSKSDGFSYELYEVVLLYAIVFTAVLFFLKKHPNYLKASTLLFVVLASLGIFKNYKTSKQQNLTFHFIPKSSGISLISQNKATFISEQKTISDDRIYGFHLKNYYDKIGIDNVDFIGLEENEGQKTIIFNNERVLWLRKKDYGKINDKFDKVLISKNAIYDIEKAFVKLPKEIILDDSNSSYYTKRIKDQCEKLGVKVINLYDTGGVVLNLAKITPQSK